MLDTPTGLPTGVAPGFARDEHDKTVLPARVLFTRICAFVVVSWEGNRVSQKKLSALLGSMDKPTSYLRLTGEGVAMNQILLPSKLAALISIHLVGLGAYSPRILYEYFME